MIEIYIHKNFEQEKKYVFDFLFKDVFGVEYKMFTHTEQNYHIKFGEKIIIISDKFFSQYQPGYKYYENSDAIPREYKNTNSVLTPEKDLPVIFGDEKFEINQNTAFIGNDIVGGIFFMLTLWEEIALKSCRDKHDRFDEKCGFLKKMNLHRRPLVNEYAEFLWNVLCEMNYNCKRREKKYRVFLTHDIDEFERYGSFIKYVKALGGDLLKRNSLKKFVETNKDYFNKTIKKENDVFDTFDYFMDIAESKNLKSHFYFQTGKIGETDVKFDINNKKLRKKIKSILFRGHNVGIHPSYTTYNDSKQFAEELKRIKNIHPQVSEGRQHFLRFKNPDTWNLWEQNGLKTDSSIGYHSDIGFRAGVCHEYPVFDVINRKQLNLVERPLNIMDTALIHLSSDKNELQEICKNLINTTKKYNGDIVILWHNSNLKRHEWEGWDKFYEEIVGNA